MNRSIKKNNIREPLYLIRHTHTHTQNKIFEFRTHTSGRHPLVCVSCACSPLAPRLLIIVIYCWIMWMVMRGCSRSRITPAVFSHSRADGREEVWVRRTERVHCTRATGPAIADSGAGQGVDIVARSFVALKRVISMQNNTQNKIIAHVVLINPWNSAGANAR